MTTKKTPYILFGKRLKELRKKAGYKTQQDFADNFKFSNGTTVTLESVQSWEQGRQLPTRERQIEIAKAFGVNLDYLLGTIEEKTHDLQFICDYTGLSGDAISRIAEIKEGRYIFDTETLNAFFLVNNSAHFLTSLQRVKDCYRETKKALKELPTKIKQAESGPIAYSDLDLILNGTGKDSLAHLRMAWYATLQEFSLMCQEFLAPLPMEIEKELSQYEKSIRETMDRLLAEWKREQEGGDGEGHTQG